jgi:hypothetical protein
MTHTNPWKASPLLCDDCEMELTEEQAYGNKTYGEPRCEDCFVAHKYGEGD